MKILEARDGFIKFESEEKVVLSSFIQISGLQKRYIAQLVRVTRKDDRYIAVAKILFLYDGTLQKYDKTLPSKDSEISGFTFDILNKSLDYETPVIAGKFIEGGINIPLDKGCFDKKMLISSDNPAGLNIIISNLAQQFPKSVIIDMQGIINGLKYTAGRDFRLPLNTESLEFMYEDCLNDATADSKSMIKEIFADLSEYSKTIPFVPFGALKNIVDDMVDKSHIFKLLVLKNKLAKFDQVGCFAALPAEAENLGKILASDNAVIDLSKLDAIFQNRYLSVIYSILEQRNPDVQVFVVAANTINKKNIKNILTNKHISSVFATHSKFKYINEIKSMFDNFIIEPSFANNEIFKIYSAFLNSIPKDTYLLVGEGTNYIPLISKLERFAPPAPVSKVEEEPLQESVHEELAPAEEEIETEIEPAENSPEDAAIQETEVEEVLEEPVIEDSELIEEESLPEPEASEPEEEVIQPMLTDEEIEKKSEELIDKLTDEAAPVPEEINLFDEEEEPILAEPESEEPEELVIEEPEIVEEPVLTESDLDETPVLTEEELESPILDEEPQEFHTEVDEIQTIEIPEEISDFAEEEREFEEKSYSDDINNSFEERMDVNIDEIGFKEYTAEDEQILAESVIPLSESDDELEEFVEIDASEVSDDDIIVDFTDDEPLDEEALDKEIVEDVDKVFTTIKDDSISDSDLDFIDELNNDAQADVLEPEFEELPEMLDESDEDGFLEPLEESNSMQEDDFEEKEILQTRNTSTPIVPVYDADIPQEDLVMSDSIEQGDTVVHAKYGNGVVEKMIKYGTKTLYSINFDNVGRRLLDPTLTEIKKS